jgi:hypothetical protein
VARWVMQAQLREETKRAHQEMAALDGQKISLQVTSIQMMIRIQVECQQLARAELRICCSAKPPAVDIFGIDWNSSRS